MQESLRSLSLRLWVCHPPTRIHTGRLGTLRQHPARACLGRGRAGSGAPPTHADQRSAFVEPRGRDPKTEAHPWPPNASLPTISSTFNSLFKVLFIFPSRYLFAIGLSPGCIPKQPDSTEATCAAIRPLRTGLSPSLASRSRELRSSARKETPLDYNSILEQYRFSAWALPGSLAVTRGILVSFSSSA
eukprot:PRCOL_00001091-RA